MQQYTLHGSAPPASTLTQVSIGIGPASYFLDHGYCGVTVLGVGTQAVKVFHDPIAPSITLTQVAIDGSHNAAMLTGKGSWIFKGYIHDTGVISKFLASTLSFIGYSIRKLNSTFIIPLESVLNTAAQCLKQTSKFVIPLIPTTSIQGLRFRTDFMANPSTIQVIQIFFSSLLNLTATEINRARPLLSAVLSFIGGFTRPPKSKILTAALSFVGVFRKLTKNVQTAVVQFTTSFVNRGVLFTSNLVLSGNLIRIRGKIFTATIAFISRTTKKIIPQAYAATLSFVGVVLHSIPTFTASLTGTLSFSGFFTAGKKFFKSNTATLSFVGAFIKRKSALLTAALSFSGVFKKQSIRIYQAILSFVGTFTRGAPNIVNFTATLSFVGSFIKKRARLLTATLSFVGNVFTGPQVKQILLVGNLRFIGFFRAVQHFHLTLITFAANLRFRGAISWTWKNLKAFILMVTGATDRRVLARSNQELKPRAVVEVIQTVTTTPTTLDIGTLTPPFNGLFIKNTDTSHTLTVDSAATFVKNPQVIPAGRAIYLNPALNSAVHVKASGTIQVQTIAGVHDAGVPGTRPQLFVRFTVNVHDESDEGDFIHLGDGGSNSVAVFRDSVDAADRFWFYYNGNPDNALGANGSFQLDTQYTIDMRLIWTGATIVCIPRVDGVDLNYFTCEGLIINTLQFGALFSVGTMNHNLDSLAIGTTGYGSSDLFSADFSSTIVPPFDSITGSGLSISGGTLLVTGTGDSYATKALSYP